MVRRVRLGSDENLGDLDPSQRRPNFDDLDELVFDDKPARSRRPKSDDARRVRRRRPRTQEAGADRRHLADADWLAHPPEPPAAVDPAA